MPDPIFIIVTFGFFALITKPIGIYLTKVLDPRG